MKILIIVSILLVSCGKISTPDIKKQVTITEREILLNTININKDALSDNGEIELVENAKKEATKSEDNKKLKIVNTLVNILVETHNKGK